MQDRSAVQTSVVHAVVLVGFFVFCKFDFRVKCTEVNHILYTGTEIHKIYLLSALNVKPPLHAHATS